MTLSQLYIRSVVYPGIALIPLSIIFAVIENRNYESEWMTKESATGLTIIAAVLYSLLICLLSLTIFLNKYEKITTNALLSGLCWFLLPGTFMCAVIFKAWNEYLTMGSDGEIELAIVVNLPFIVGLTWGFWRFHKQRHR
jgi:hypothetical protein